VELRGLGACSGGKQVLRRMRDSPEEEQGLRRVRVVWGGKESQEDERAGLWRKRVSREDEGLSVKTKGLTRG
jgi:hypothetical protein